MTPRTLLDTLPRPKPVTLPPAPAGMRWVVSETTGQKHLEPIR